MTTERRLERLERTVQRQRLVLSAVVLAAVCVGLIGAGGDDVAEVTRTRRLEVLNDEGGPMVIIASADSRGVVVTYNAKNETLVEIGATTSGEGAIGTFNGNGQDLVYFGATTANEGRIVTYNAKGDKLVEIGSRTDGEGVIAMFNRAGGVSDVRSDDARRQRR